MQHQVLLTLAMICISGALPQSSLLDDFDANIMKCTNTTVEERKICRSELMEETQLKIQLENLRVLMARAHSEETRWRTEHEHNFRKDAVAERRDAEAERRSAVAERRENITFEHALQKDAAADRSLVFPGLTVDPYDEKSVIIALITLASFLAFGILNCCRHDSRQPMLIVNTFVLIMFSIINGLVLVDTSKWFIWLPVSTVIMVLGVVLPIHFMGDGRVSFYAVLTNSDTEKTLNYYLMVIMIVEALAVMLRYAVFSLSPYPEHWRYWAALVVFFAMMVLFYCLRLNCSIRRAVGGVLFMATMLAVLTMRLEP
uniref:Uncharacterized protein n=1 Tax=Cryptomonas curvata TaxID=233186 RepID=A0A7S0MG27_9CRYP|mmetsp:Transcript_39557/g.82794  ORF Transcript_39557/g.82794 Transcript_39557/m.82794 type:complete len:315 (+) Transcript_39557:28-972(+)